jgi:hypothetical protein
MIVINDMIVISDMMSINQSIGEWQLMVWLSIKSNTKHVVGVDACVDV